MLAELSIRIGTSGWHYKHWLGPFYPSQFTTSQMFQFYAHRFETVEINNSFYQLPSATTIESWRDAAPEQFLFSVKASRFITHMKKLKDPPSSFAKFFARVDLLGEKLGPVLFQLPPRWKVNVDRLREFVSALPTEHKYVFEFRDESWLVQPIYDVLRDYNAAFCIHDFADMKIPCEITSDFTYVRFHGPTSTKYAGSYSIAQLRHWAKWFDERGAELNEIYVYFNNDPAGAAVKNALTLKRLVSA